MLRKKIKKYCTSLKMQNRPGSHGIKALGGTHDRDAVNP